MTKRKELLLIMNIIERADKMDLIRTDKLDLRLDLGHAHDRYNLRLSELLQADRYNFTHDIVGIQNNIKRQTKMFNESYLPRFAASSKAI